MYKIRRKKTFIKVIEIKLIIPNLSGRTFNVSKKIGYREGRGLDFEPLGTIYCIITKVFNCKKKVLEIKIK